MRTCFKRRSGTGNSDGRISGILASSLRPKGCIKEMIDRHHELPISRQCQILSLARSTADYRPQQTSEADLALMRRIDELHLEFPFAGSRMLRDLLHREGFTVGRKHAATLMKQMGIEALYKKPDTSRRHAAHPIYPYLRRGFVYLFAVMDWASRRGVSWRVSNMLTTDFCIEALTEAIH